jgi:hypothetical protein
MKQNDVTVKQNKVTPTFIGNPVSGAPEDARKICCLKRWQNRLYIGYGNWNTNYRYPSIKYYSLEDAKFHTENCFWECDHTLHETIADHAIGRYVIIDSDLYIPGTDPDDTVVGHRIGTFYRKGADGKGWIMYNTIPRVAHNFDMIKYQGLYFAALGAGLNNCLQYSNAPEDDGSWNNAVHLTKGTQQRFNQLFEIDGVLYAVALQFSYARKVFRFDNKTNLFEMINWDLMPGNTSSGVSRLEILDENVFCIPESRDELYMADPKSSGQPLPKHNPEESFYDIKVANDLIYALTAVQSTTGYTVRIYTINSSAPYVGCVQTELDFMPFSLEIVDNLIYLGDVRGNIFSIPDTTKS